MCVCVCMYVCIYSKPEASSGPRQVSQGLGTFVKGVVSR